MAAVSTRLTAHGAWLDESPPSRALFATGPPYTVSVPAPRRAAHLHAAVSGLPEEWAHLAGYEPGIDIAWSSLRARCAQSGEQF
jgi:hypothetical protein